MKPVTTMLDDVTGTNVLGTAKNGRMQIVPIPVAEEVTKKVDV